MLLPRAGDGLWAAAAASRVYRSGVIRYFYRVDLNHMDSFARGGLDYEREWALPRDNGITFRGERDHARAVITSL